MKSGTYSIAIEAQIILSRRELAVLNHICSFDQSGMLKGCVSTHYEGGVTLDEMIKLLQDLQRVTGEQMARIQNAKTDLFGSRCASIPSQLEPNPIVT